MAAVEETLYRDGNPVYPKTITNQVVDKESGTTLPNLLNNKQDTLVSGTTIKTVNGNSLLGTGDITISSDGTISVDTELSTTSTNSVQNKVITNAVNTKQDTLVSGTSIKTINNNSLLGSGNITIEGSSGTSDYTALTNKPSINSIELSGNKTLSDLNIASVQSVTDEATARVSADLLKEDISNKTTTLNASSTDTQYPSSKVVYDNLVLKASDLSLTAHTSNTSNPHSVTKSQVGLSNVDNTSDADKPVSTAQATAINAKYTKPVLGIPKTDLVTAVQTSLGKADTALQSFTETDPTVPSWAKQTNKPTYIAKEVGAISFSEKGANNGVAELDSSGKVLSSQLPSYVDDVLEYATLANFPTTGETGKIYIAINTNLTYRWTGTTYTEISPSMALGETSATAYRGDRGKIAYDHSQTAHAPSTAQKNSDITKAEIEAKLIGAITSHTHAYASTSHAHNASDINAGTLAIARIPTGTTASTVSLGNHTHSNYVPTSRTVAGKALTANITLAKGDVGLGSVDNTSDANKPVSTAQQTALNAKMDSSKFQVVESLPASPVSGTFYFVKE